MILGREKQEIEEARKGSFSGGEEKGRKNQRRG